MMLYGSWLCHPGSVVFLRKLSYHHQHNLTRRHFTAMHNSLRQLVLSTFHCVFLHTSQRINTNTRLPRLKLAYARRQLISNDSSTTAGP